MRLTEREIDCLIIHNAGFLAQKRLARGLQLNYPESVALISSQVLSFPDFVHKYFLLNIHLDLRIS